MASIGGRWCLKGVLGGLALAACTGGPSHELAGEPGLFLDVKKYYERHAMEVGGRCRTPELGGVIGTRVIERTGERLVIEARYTYDDPNAELKGECRGIGQRTFTVVRRGGGHEVVAMTGPQHPKGIRIDRIDDSKVW